MRTSEPRRPADDERPHGRNGRGTPHLRDDAGSERAREAARWAGDEDLPSRRRPAARDHGYERAEGYQGGQSGWSRHGAYEGRPDDQLARTHGDASGPPSDWQGGRPRDDQGQEGYYQGRSDYRGGNYDTHDAHARDVRDHGEGPRDEWHRSGVRGAPQPGPFVGKGPRGYRRSDERIAEDVNERLTAHADVDAGDIDVKVTDGEVTLTDTVDSRRTRRLAEDIAADVPGVRDVQNQLRVARTG